MKILSLAALLTSLASVAYAQTSTITSGAGSASDSRAASQSTLQQINVIPGGGIGTGNGVGYLNTNTTGTVWTLGGTPSINTTQYDACTKYFSASAILAGLSIPAEIEQCWSMRMADSIAKYPPGSVQYNLLCRDSNVLRNDWDTGTMKCTNNQARLRKENPNDPRAAPYQGVPVVAVSGPGMPQTIPNAVPPQGLALPGTNAPITQLRRCSRTVQDNCISG